MIKSLSKLYVHAILHVKNNNCTIRPEDELRFYAFINGVLILNESSLIVINGTENHIHVLCVVSKNISTANLLEDIMEDTRRWTKSLDIHYQNFEWQNDYCCYSVSKSRLKNVQKFIEDQKEIHKTQTFEDEYRQFLNENEIDYKEEYLWS
ncbi:MAG: transposase [Bacteroidota bacterium]|nr:transposase [Bacteroidota bacterium]